jgi:hypothetical protein
MAELDIVLGEMRAGFERIEKHYATFHDAYMAHLLTCQDKFSAMKEAQATKRAADLERENHNYWPFIIKAGIGFLTGSCLMLIYRVVIHMGP